MLTFPILILCGVLTVFSRAVSYESSPWVALSFGFLPILLSTGVLLALGVLLAKIHSSETRGLSLDLKKILTGSSELLASTSYLSVPSILTYLCLWIFLGFFFLLKEIPFIGDFFSVVLSFGPFLLLFGSLLLCVFNLGLLFFVAPAAALQSYRNVSLAKRVLETLKTRALSSLLLLFLALIPLGIVAGLLTTAAIFTNLSFSVAAKSLTVALEWFFIMVPFALILTPAVVFFFNFAAESYLLLQMGLTETPKAPFPAGKREEAKS